MTAKSKRRFGLFLVVGSVAILLMLLPAYAIVTFVISQILVVNESSNIAVIGQVISFVLGISGVLALVGIPVGAVLMSRAGLDPKAGEELKEEQESELMSALQRAVAEGVPIEGVEAKEPEGGPALDEALLRAGAEGIGPFTRTASAKAPQEGGVNQRIEQLGVVS